MKLLAVDGNSILNRAFYGIKLLSTKDGFFTNGIYGFLTILMRMQQETEPEAIAISFDTKSPTFRHEMFSGYKAHRKGMPEELAMQLPVLKELLHALGYKTIEIEGYEADDILGTLARETCETENECVIASGDRDLFQLITNCVTVRLASTKMGKPTAEIYDENTIYQKYGVTPPELIEVKALMGDPSDGIPGVPGIGEKTALNLIQNFKSLDNIYTNIDTLTIKENLKNKLKDNKELAYTCRKLAEINRFVPIDAGLKLYKKDPVSNKEAYSIMARLELFSLMERFGVRPESLEKGEDDTALGGNSAIDIEFNSISAESLYCRENVDILFSFKGECIDAACISLDGKLVLITENAEEFASKILADNVPKRTNNLKKIHHFALKNGFQIKGVVFDAEIAGYILNATASSYEISKLAAEYNIFVPKIDNILNLYPELLGEAATLTPLADKLLAKISQNGQEMLLREIELPLAGVLAGMEHEGFLIDSEGLRSFGEKLDSDIASLTESIYTMAGCEFNINSPKQLGDVLFENLGLPHGKKTKTGYSTNAAVLDSLLDKHPIIFEILNYRTLSKLKSTYVDGLLKLVKDDSRIHTNFQQTLTRTGRISSIEPNMQNIPIKTEIGSELRRFFIAPGGKKLVDADYSQIELRVLAHISNDENMINAFKEEEDIHLNTASQVFDMPKEFVTAQMRGRAKAVNFGIVYGIGAFSLSKDIGVSIKEADSYIKSYLETYRGVANYMTGIVESGTANGYVETLYGRRRYMPELAASNGIIRESGKRIAMNTPIQGTAADIIKIAMVKVYNRLKKENLKSRLILQIHDELIIEADEDEIEAVKVILKEEMESAATLSVPLTADVNTGGNWLASK